MKHYSQQKNAFTLVELIVVITILAILGTIAFISLQWYGVQSRDAKRISDINNLYKKIALEYDLKKTLPIEDYIITWDGSKKITSSFEINGVNPTAYEVWSINFDTLKESADDFLDPNNTPYVFAYVSDDNGTYYQLAASLEKDNTAIVSGSYFQNNVSDTVGLILSTDGTNIVQDGEPYLPY